jgi:proteic killer suppression protein
MILSFRDAGTSDVFDGADSRAANRVCPKTLWNVARRKLDQLDSVKSLQELRSPPGNRLEALIGDRRGGHSIRINEKYRVCFVWTENGPDAVQIVDYH